MSSELYLETRRYAVYTSFFLKAEESITITPFWDHGHRFSPTVAANMNSLEVLKSQSN